MTEKNNSFWNKFFGLSPGMRVRINHGHGNYYTGTITSQIGPRSYYVKLDRPRKIKREDSETDIYIAIYNEDELEVIDY